jgi:GGDEF domain-containing protein
LLKVRFSMRFTLGATIILMGMLGLLLALTTGEIYRNQTLESQRTALAELVQISVGEQLHDLEERARDLGLAMQSEPDFRRALASGKRDVLTHQLLNQFHQYFVTANIIKLEKLVVYDAGYRPLSTAKAGGGVADNDAPGCPTLIERARTRTGAERLHSLAALCLNNHQARYAVLVPAGGLKPIGYIEVVTDPVPVLARIESRLGFPVRIRDAQDRRVFSTESWPPPNAMHNALLAEHVMTTAADEPILKIAVVRDVERLQRGLAKTRWLVMTLAIAITLLGVFLALYILEKTTLQPLNNLALQLRRVGSNRDHLGEQVETGGIAEIRELGEDFNQMARELDRLYGSLEHMAFTDPLTNLPNRARFRDSLEESARQYKLVHQPFALFLMDLDRFKAVNDTLGHQIGDLLLQEVSTRLRSVLRETDTVARLDNETIVGLEGKMVARLGGDEFAAILPRVSSIDDASAVARKLLLSMQNPFLVRGHAISIGISIGIALYPQHGEDIDSLMQRADAAMYFAKNNQCGLAFPDTMQQVELI